MLSNFSLQLWGSVVYKQWLEGAQSSYLYTDKIYNRFACALMPALNTFKQLHILGTFHSQNLKFKSVTKMLIHTIHKTYYNNNYLNKYNSNRGINL